MNKFRWWLSKRISAFGWWVMPEPQRTAAMNDWIKVVNSKGTSHE